MESLLERLCELTGHAYGPLCAWVIRRDAWWRDLPAASARHRELRTVYESGMNDLPFPGAQATAAEKPPAVERKSKSA